MVKIRVLQPDGRDAIIIGYQRFPHFEVLTTSVEGFKNWCLSKGLYDIHIDSHTRSHRFSSKRQMQKYDGPFYRIKAYHRNSSGSKEEIIKRWGYFRPEYDTLTWYEKIDFNMGYYFGIFEKILPL